MGLFSAKIFPANMTECNVFVRPHPQLQQSCRAGRDPLFMSPEVKSLDGILSEDLLVVLICFKYYYYSIDINGNMTGQAIAADTYRPCTLCREVRTAEQALLCWTMNNSGLFWKANPWIAK